MIHGDGSLKHFGVCKVIFKTRSEVLQKTQRDFGTDRRNRDHLDDLDDDLDAGRQNDHSSLQGIKALC